MKRASWRKWGYAPVTAVLAAAISLALSGGSGVPARAQYQEPGCDVSMTMFQVLTGANGQQYYTNQYGETVQLPGPGVGGAAVGVYSAPDGMQWYIDRYGRQQVIAAMSHTFVPPSDGYGQTPYNQMPPAPYAQNQPAASSSSSSSSAPNTRPSYNVNLGLGSLLGGLPLGTPVYWGGGGGPYYYGGGGQRTYISQNTDNFNRFNEWRNQNNNWHNHWWNRPFNPDRNSWPGKDHGFPPPWQHPTGRLYSPNPESGQPGADQARADRAADEHAGEGRGREHAADEHAREGRGREHAADEHAREGRGHHGGGRHRK